MKPNHTGLIICLLLAVVTGLILFVESKRPIYVDITMEEIHKEICNAEAQAQKDDKEETNYRGQSTHPEISKSYDKEEKKGDLM